jgi:hypothetical protein
MPDGYVELEAVMISPAPSGKSLFVRHEGRKLNVPCFAVHEDSEVHLSTYPGDKGVLILREDIAIDRDLVDPGHAGGGIPLKRDRLPKLPVQLDISDLQELRRKLDADEVDWYVQADGLLVIGTEPVLILGDVPRPCRQLLSEAPSILHDLLDEIETLRAWADKTLAWNEKRTARRRKRG